jgi:signal transduction histidine kinase
MSIKNFLKNPAQRIFLMTVLGYLLIVGYFTVWSYQSQCAQAEVATLLRLEGIANVLALQIDGDAHQKLTNRFAEKDAVLFNAQDTDYNKIHIQLRRIYEAQMLKSPTYTMVYDTAAKHFEFIATSSETPYFRHVYTSFKPILIEKFTEGGTIPMYTDQFGMWLTAFAPVRNRLGEVVAVVMVDERFDDFIKNARWAAWLNLCFALLIILPVMVVLVIGLRRQLFREARLKRQIEVANDTNLKMRQELEVSYEKLASVDTLRKEMIANISHDLRTPLTNLSGYLETLFMRRHNISLAESERFLTIAQKESQRLKKLIDDLFELSKLESNQVDAKVEPFPIAELLQDVVSKYAILCEKQGIDITTNLSENIPWVVADIKLTDRVLQNLMDNAIRYNQKSDNGERGKIDLQVEAKGERVYIRIGNTSATIPPSVLERLFDRYFKVASEVEGATGLGLAIVKKIADLQGSILQVSSENGWTSFKFCLAIYSK